MVNFFLTACYRDLPSLAGALLLLQERIALVFLSLAVLYSLCLKQ